MALTQAGTRLADQAYAATDTAIAATAERFDEQALVSQVITISAINTWNRINVTTAQPAGEWRAGILG